MRSGQYDGCWGSGTTMAPVAMARVFLGEGRLSTRRHRRCRPAGQGAARWSGVVPILSMYAQLQADNYLYLCVVAGGSPPMRSP